MVLNLILIGLAIALDPLPLTAFMIVLPSSKRGVRKGAAFVFGWLVWHLAIVVTITVVATGNNPPKPSAAPSLASLALRLRWNRPGCVALRHIRAGAGRAEEVAEVAGAMQLGEFIALFGYRSWPQRRCPWLWSLRAYIRQGQSHGNARQVQDLDQCPRRDQEEEERG